MGSLDRPKLRPLSARRFERDGQVYAVLEDPLGVFSNPVLIPAEGFQFVVRHFDGRRSLTEIQTRVQHETGRSLATDELVDLVSRLDRALVLDGPTYGTFLEDYVRQPVRPAALAGRSYPAVERDLRVELGRFFTDGTGAGLPCPDAAQRDGRLRGVICPHIDFQRGGSVYSWAYKELVERSDAEVFVILGVAHQYCANRFALTRKDFQTPLGIVATDREFVDRLAEEAGPHLFEDELTHRGEHSIEFQAVFLQYLLGGRRDFTIVPILVGSFHDLMGAGVDPIEDDEVRRFVAALQTTEAARGKKVAYLGAIDLSHVGPEFGDPELIDAATLRSVDGFDHAMLDRAAANDPRGWFETAARVDNRWRVCGLAATYTFLHAIGPARGRLLRYQQALNARRTCCVSFASLTFEADPADVAPGDRARG